MFLIHFILNKRRVNIMHTCNTCGKNLNVYQSWRNITIVKFLVDQLHIIVLHVTKDFQVISHYGNIKKDVEVKSVSQCEKRDH